MEPYWLLVLFLFNTFLVWRMTRDYFKREYGKAMWRNWTAQTYHWQGAIYLSTALTFIMILILRGLDVLDF
jgi:hypothetical protein